MTGTGTGTPAPGIRVEALRKRFGTQEVLRGVDLEIAPSELMVIIGRSGGKTPKVEQAKLEAAIRDIVRTWEDALDEAAAKADIDPKLADVAAHFASTAT